MGGPGKPPTDTDLLIADYTERGPVSGTVGTAQSHPNKPQKPLGTQTWANVARGQTSKSGLNIARSKAAAQDKTHVTRGAKSASRCG